MQNSLPCILCGSEIPPLNWGNDDSDSDIVSNMTWNNGDVAILHCGYGSRHDLTNFIIAICDDCIEKSLQNGRIAILSYE